MRKVTEVSKVKKGGYIIHEGEAYKVTDIQHSKAGKHGHGKYRIFASSVLGTKKTSIVMGSGHKIDVPIIEKHNAQVLTIEESVENVAGETIKKVTANVMNAETYETFDIIVPEELWGQVKEGSKVMYWNVMGTKVMKQVLG